ncbi:uncharacterized protein LOC129591342 [Paramacrobiotus metropolitanus]|uniref:uncharacterized protein LOC129591342 n=1 Tax=Paramacrobiotus metropolitanus TaxID=2943436 RepID=UPI0024464503|nr:uncharacterized protein LOC129591342 [Paramacrobiotus metropolitanus]
MDARVQNQLRNVLRLPIKWRYGAIASGVALTQVTGFMWYSPGSAWSRQLPPTTFSQSSTEMTINLITQTAVDTGFAFLLHYLSSRYFRPATMQDALVFAGLISAAQLIPQIPQVLWGRKPLGLFFVDQAFIALGIFVKILCIQNIPY